MNIDQRALEDVSVRYNDEVVSPREQEQSKSSMVDDADKSKSSEGLEKYIIVLETWNPWIRL